MATTIVTKSGSGAPTASDLVAGELAVDLTNKRLYTEDSGGTVLEVGSNPYNFTANHDGSAKLATTATGIDVTGTVTADGLTVSAPAGDTPASIVTTTGGSFLQFTDGNTTAGRSPLVGAITDDLVFYTNAGSYSEKLRIDANGNVGIGCTPASKLDIDISTDARGSFSSGIGEVGSGNFALQVTNSAGSALKPLGFRAEDIRFATGSAERLRIDASGNVGIGTSSPRNDANFKTLQIGDSSAAASQLVLDDNDSSGPWRIISNLSLIINDDTNERMRIDASGNLLVGQSTANSGAAGISLRANGQVFATAASTYVTQLNRNTNDGDILKFAKDDTTVGSIGVANGDNLYIATDDTNDVGLKFNGDGNRITPCDASGADRGSAIDLGEAGGGLFKDLYLSGGMKLSRAVTSETEIESYNNTDSGGAKYKISFKQNGTQVGVIEVGTSTTGYLTSSDYRLKENVAPLTSATERLKQLNPSRFNFIADADKTVDGFLAHEVQDVVPEAISGTKDAMRDEEYEVTPAVLDDDGNVVTEAVMGTRSVPDYQGIDQSKLVPLLVATIQELEARIAALES